MNLFWVSLRLSCKQLLRHRGIIWMLLALPLLCGLVASFFAGGEPLVQLRVGVVYDLDEPFAQEVFASLRDKNGPIRFEPFAPDRAGEVERLVQTGALECAYVLEPTLLEALQKRPYSKGVTLLKTPRTTADLYASEVLFAALYERGAPYLDENVIEQVLKLPPEQSFAFIEERYAYYADNAGQFLQPVYDDQGGGPLAEVQNRPAVGRLLHGLVALFSFAVTAFGIPQRSAEYRSVLPRLVHQPLHYVLGNCTGMLLPHAAAAISALLLARLRCPDGFGSLHTELFWLLLYLVSLNLLGTLISLTLRRSGPIYAGTVFLLLLTAVFGGVAADLAEIRAGLSGVSNFFITNHYMQGVIGSDPIHWFTLAAIAVGSVLGTTLLVRIRYNHPFSA